MIRLSADTRRDADVIVVGGGPAGAACAFHLAARGMDALILDGAVFPRDKVCGDFVGPVALSELGPLGVTETAHAANANPVREAAVFLDGEHVLTKSLPHGSSHRPYGLVIPRQRLDNWILEAAIRCGARVEQKVQVSGFETGSDHIRVVADANGQRRILRAGLLIGADGSKSTVGDQLRGRVSRRDRIIAIRAYLEGIGGPPDRADLLFHTDTFPGYTWVFPTGPDTANVGVGMTSESFPKTGRALRPVLIELMESDPALRQRLGEARTEGRIKGFPLTTYNPNVPVSGPRVLLVGDAAGLINPINGEGIQYALLSGRWAAETAHAARHGDFDEASLAGYATRLRREVGSDLTLARLIVQLLTNRDLNPIWLGALKMILNKAGESATFAELAGGILAGVMPTTKALGFRMLRGLAAESASEARSLVDAFREDPVHTSVHLGMEAASVGFHLAYDAVTETSRLRDWAASVVGTGVAVGKSLAADATHRTLGT